MGITRLLLVFAVGCAGAPAAPAESAASPAASPPAHSQAGTATPVVSIPNAKTPLPGLLTGGQPSDAQLQEAAAAGYGTVISLRTPGEPGSEGEAATVEGLGMRFVSIPVAGADDLTDDNARALAAALAAAEGPVLLHCGSGNRAGALLALKAHVVDGQDAATALSLGERAGLTKLRPALEERLNR